jgi:hypothetical protein
MLLVWTAATTAWPFLADLANQDYGPHKHEQEPAPFHFNDHHAHHVPTEPTIFAREGPNHDADKAASDRIPVCMARHLDEKLARAYASRPPPSKNGDCSVGSAWFSSG